MDLNKYQEETAKTAVYPTLEVTNKYELHNVTDRISFPYLYPALGLAGETGEVLELIKKTIRSRQTLTEENRQKLKLELGDVFWYLSQLSTDLGFTLNEVAEANIKKLQERYNK